MQVELAVLQRDVTYLVARADETLSALRTHIEEDKIIWAQVQQQASDAATYRERDTDRHGVVETRLQKLEDRTEPIVVGPQPGPAANDAEAYERALARRRVLVLGGGGVGLGTALALLAEWLLRVLGG